MLLTLGKGFDEINFGANKNFLARTLGEPDKIDRDESGCPLLIYNTLRCTLWLNEKGLLHWIQCSNRSARLLDQAIVDTPIESTLSKLCQILGDEYEFEDYGSMDSYTFDSQELELQVTYGLVSAVCFGHFWADDDQPVFPVY